MLATHPFGSKVAVTRFTVEAKKHHSNTQELNLLISIFKLAVFLKVMIEQGNKSPYEYNINGIVYDTLNSIIAIFESRDRYLNLNLRSLIEHIARISLSNSFGGMDYDQTVRRKDFEQLKKENPNEGWKYMHECYSHACSYLHASPKANLNIDATFLELLCKDSTTKTIIQIEKTQKILSTAVKIFITNFQTEVSSVFIRNQGELKYMLGTSLYKEYLRISEANKE